MEKIKKGKVKNAKRENVKMEKEQKLAENGKGAKWKNGKRHGRATTYTNFSFGKKRKRPKNNNDYDRIRRRVWENDKETGKNW